MADMQQQAAGIGQQQQQTNLVTSPLPSLDMLPKATMNVSMNLVDLILLDHARLRTMYETYKLPTTDAVHKQLLAWEMICEISSHAAKEEMVLYPAIRAAMGDDIANKCLADHANVKSMSAVLDTLVITDPSFEPTLINCLEANLAHIREEEEIFLPQFMRAVTPETLLQLGIRFQVAAARAPTRPHPEVPPLPPYNEASYAAAKQIDTVLDQARFPSVIPPAVGLAEMSPAGATAGGAGTMEGGVGIHEIKLYDRLEPVDPQQSGELYDRPAGPDIAMIDPAIEHDGMLTVQQPRILPVASEEIMPLKGDENSLAGAVGIPELFPPAGHEPINASGMRKVYGGTLE